MGVYHLFFSRDGQSSLCLGTPRVFESIILRRPLQASPLDPAVLGGRSTADRRQIRLSASRCIHGYAFRRMLTRRHARWSSQMVSSFRSLLCFPISFLRSMSNSKRHVRAGNDHWFGIFAFACLGTESGNTGYGAAVAGMGSINRFGKHGSWSPVAAGNTKEQKGWAGTILSRSLSSLFFSSLWSGRFPIKLWLLWGLFGTCCF